MHYNKITLYFFQFFDSLFYVLYYKSIKLLFYSYLLLQIITQFDIMFYNMEYYTSH